MTRSQSRMRLVGATVLRDGILQDRTVAIEDGVISKGPFPEVDFSGFVILPGIVDLHVSQSAWQGAGRDVSQALRAADRRAAAAGITTLWLAQGWSWEDGPRGPDAAAAFLRSLSAQRSATDLRARLVCETHTVDSEAYLLAAICAHRVGSVSFGNRIEELRQMADLAPHLFAQEAALACRSPAEHRAALDRAAAQAAQVPRHLCRLAEAFDGMGVQYGSHRDGDGETRETYSMIGAKICAFPAHRTAAGLARAVGDPVVQSAAELMRDPGGATAMQLRAGLGCALASGRGFGPAAAALALVGSGQRDLAAAWALVSARPAEIMRLTDRGVIDFGKRADLTVLNPATGQIEATIARGRVVHAAGAAARRLGQLGVRAALAAE